VIFVADTSGYVYALNSSDGSLIWENKIGGCIDISSPTISGGLIFIGTRDDSNGAFFALEESTGEILWKYPISASITAPPSIVDGMMLCGTDNWYMYAFNFGIGGGDWLLHRYDSSNTAYSPNGLTTWQYVEAQCTTNNDITTCIVTNYYDHDVKNITLKLDFNAYWYDSLGNLLKSDSDYYIMINLPTSSTMTFIISKNPLENLPPVEPIINGPTNGKAGTSYDYNFTATDPDGDDVKYYIEWGDGNTEWTGFSASGTPVIVSHTWDEEDTYIITAKAQDEYGLESDWATLEVEMPVNQQVTNPLLQMILERFPNAFPILRYLLGL
jgi:hypothetical protein